MQIKSKYIVSSSFLLLSFFSIFVDAQTSRYTFDDCTFVDQAGILPAATPTSDPSCDCGLTADGLYFDGNNDNLIFPSEIDSLMELDFTISFYFRFDQVSSRTDILSVRSECSLDSFLAITYNPSNNEIALELAQNIGNIETQNVLLDPSVCWHRLVLTKSELFYSLYLDDELAITILSDGLVNFDKNARLTINNSPCLAVNLDRFNGWIDEFIFYQRALAANEIVANSLNPDQITTNDTTIIAGSPVDINVGSTCATNFTWTPETDLDDPSILNPTATPSTTIAYSLNIENDGNCITSDMITINVIDPNELDCTSLLLPNAFTPNNDQLNDRFGISSLFLIDQMEYFEIYDRWGGKMWTAINKTDTWDGTFNGQPVNSGMYIYKVKYTCTDQEFVKVDNFSVLR
ncbi:MAG: gliding motility-associated-like protein [Saprospiraceae bacterium]|jgi:gliding motility-associated-like protein